MGHQAAPPTAWLVAVLPLLLLLLLGPAAGNRRFCAPRLHMNGTCNEVERCNCYCYSEAAPAAKPGVAVAYFGE